MKTKAQNALAAPVQKERETKMPAGPDTPLQPRRFDARSLRSPLPYAARRQLDLTFGR